MVKCERSLIVDNATIAGVPSEIVDRRVVEQGVPIDLYKNTCGVAPDLAETRYQICVRSHVKGRGVVPCPVEDELGPVQDKRCALYVHGPVHGPGPVAEGGVVVYVPITIDVGGCTLGVASQPQEERDNEQQHQRWTS